MNVYPCLLKRTKPMLIMSNGSERGDFVPVNYIQSQLGRIHDGIQVMKTYYPHNKKWSSQKRISESNTEKDVTYQWDFEYEDYHPFNLLEGHGDCKAQFSEIKRSGADIHLTVTLDLGLTDEEIETIVRSLRRYGRIFLRINHECNGNWFRFNKYHSYKEVSDFFVRCHRIVKANSSQIYTVFCISGDFFARRRVVEDQFLRLAAYELLEALQVADYWSIDRYTSLHFAWPFAKEVDRSNIYSYFDNTVDDWWRIIEECYLGMIWHNDLKMKPLFLNEFNTDADVNGLANQAQNVTAVYDRILRSDFPWLAGIVFYQFRDKGGLGLEMGDAQNHSANPSFDSYSQGINAFKYSIGIEDWQEWPNKSYIFSWPNSDSVRGLCVRGLPGSVHLTNKFNVPVYLVDKDQKWLLIKPDEKTVVAEQKEFYIFMPPFIDESGELQYFLKEDDIIKKIQTMTGAAE